MLCFVELDDVNHAWFANLAACPAWAAVRRKQPVIATIVRQVPHNKALRIIALKPASE
jgi:hypothetical protein